MRLIIGKKVTEDHDKDVLMLYEYFHTPTAGVSTGRVAVAMQEFKVSFEGPAKGRQCRAKLETGFLLLLRMLIMRSQSWFNHSIPRFLRL